MTPSKVSKIKKFHHGDGGIPLSAKFQNVKVRHRNFPRVRYQLSLSFFWPGSPLMNAWLQLHVHSTKCPHRPGWTQRLKPAVPSSTVFTCLLMWKMLEHALLAMSSLSSFCSLLFSHAHIGSLQTEKTRKTGDWPHVSSTEMLKRELELRRGVCNTACPKEILQSDEVRLDSLAECYVD